MLRRTIEKTMLWKDTQVVVIKIDLKRAFDGLFHSSIAEMLTGLDVPLFWARAVIGITPIIAGEEGPRVDVERGVRQGRIESMLLFVRAISYHLQATVEPWGQRGFELFGDLF